MKRTNKNNSKPSDPQSVAAAESKEIRGLGDMANVDRHFAAQRDKPWLKVQPVFPEANGGYGSFLPIR